MMLPTVVDRERMQQVADASPFTAGLGVKVERCEGGTAELTLSHRPDLTQHHGFLHGGLIGYLVDNVCAWAAASCSGDVLTSQYSVHLLAPGVGDRFRAVGQVVKAGRRAIVVQAQVFARNAGEEKLIAVGSATVMAA